MMMISKRRRPSNRQQKTIMIVIILFVPVLIYIISARNTVKYNYWSITTTSSSEEKMKMKIKPVPFLDDPSKNKKKNNNNGGGNDDRLLLLWWEPYIDYVAYPFSIRKSNQNHDWCVVDVDDNNNNNNNNTGTDATGSGNNKNNKIGLWFIKNYKSASSTGAGITARIAYNNNNNNNNDDDDAKKQQQQQQPCIYKANHDFADRGSHYKYGRDHNHNFLWSIVRHPSSRVISLYFYFRQQPPLSSPTTTKAATTTTTTTTTTTDDTDDNNNNNIDINIFHAVAASEKNSQVSLLNPSDERPWDHQSTTTKRKTKYNDAATIVKSIFHYYDFIAVQERLDESLVVLKLLMNLNMWDIIVLPSKQKGSYAINPTGKCTKIPNPSSSTLSELQDYLSSSSSSNNNNNNGRRHNNNNNNNGDGGSFFTRNNYDYLLHSAANKSLDMTIDKLGRTKVEREVIQYRQLQQLAYTKCYDQAIFPCNQNNGTRQRSTALSKQNNCYQQDWGCGYPCIDRLMKEQHEQQQHMY